eukprot:m51a1_g9204 putative domain containing protein (531) ;mRNA; f:850-3162
MALTAQQAASIAAGVFVLLLCLGISFNQSLLLSALAALGAVYLSAQQPPQPPQPPGAHGASAAPPPVPPRAAQAAERPANAAHAVHAASTVDRASVDPFRQQLAAQIAAAASGQRPMAARPPAQQEEPDNAGGAAGRPAGRPQGKTLRGQDARIEAMLPELLKKATLRMPKHGKDKAADQKRAKVIAEISSTEKTYVDKLNVIIQVFLEPLRKATVASAADVKTVFGDIEVIRNYNALMLESLQEARDAKAIADLFSNQLAHYLKTYSSYINNYETSLQKVQTLKANSDFAKFLKKAEADSRCTGLNLESLLIMPVQRIPRYVLLLKELIKNTEKGDPALPLLESSVEKISALASLINQRKSEAESVALVYVIQNQVTGLSEPLIDSPSRRFIKEGTVLQLDPQEKQEHELHVYLFNDVIVLAKATANSRGQRKVVELLKLSGAKSTTFQLPSGLQTWVLVGRMDETERSAYVLCATSHEAADTMVWVEATDHCIAELAQRRQSFAKARVSTDSSKDDFPKPNDEVPYSW